MGNKNGFQDYNQLRQYLSLIYLYGFFSREDFERLVEGSTKTYDSCLPIIKECIPDLERGRYEGKKKYLTVGRNMIGESEYYLAHTYFLSLLKEQELLDVWEILCRLNGTSAKKVDLVSEMADKRTSATMYRLLNDMEEFGLIACDEKSKSYSVCKNPLAIHYDAKDLNDQELKNLYFYIRFCQRMTLTHIPGHYLYYSIMREMFRRGISIHSKTMFSFARGHIHNALDEILVYPLIDLIRKHHKAVVITRMRHKTMKKTVLPVKLRIDQYFNRWYILAMEDVPVNYRLSRIYKIQDAGPASDEEWTAAENAVIQKYEHACFSDSVFQNSPYEIQVQLCFGDNKRIEKQFQREIRIGQIVERAGHTYYEGMINDPLELVPLLRSYAPWLRITKDDGRLKRHIQRDLQKMRESVAETEEA